MKQHYLLVLGIILFYCCSPAERPEPAQTTSHPIVGTWRLISGTTIQGTDTVVTDYTVNQEMIKIINDTHFAFLRHDLNNGQDSSAIFVAGGGSYSVEGNIYTEKLEYCNFREWENNSFALEFTIENDTLITKGVEKIEAIGVDHINIEKLVRVRN